MTLGLSGVGVFAVLFAWVAAERDAARQALGLFVPDSAVGDVVRERGATAATCAA